ncbi:hypothetical protein ACFY0A_37470 [Streptomyces sp. NPDC001698]|uniref:hypothetical protein n=1 Tax=Streptomyces sp. NPDC001698 TaxID=3364601 RepID=UPI003679E2FE
MSADDDAERSRIRAWLYAPPRAERRSRGQRPKPQGGAMTMQGAQALMAQLAAQDAQLGAG